MSFTVGQPQQTGLGQVLSQIGEGVSSGLQQQFQQFQEQKKMGKLQRQFQEMGYPPDLAKLAAGATTGGQTEVLKQLLEARQRGFSPTPNMLQGPIDESIETETFTEEELPSLPDFEKATSGMTPKEKVAYKKDFDKRSFERNKKYLDRIGDIAQEIPKEKVALEQMKGAIEAGDFNSWRNTLGEITGHEFLKSASAQTVNSASKQYLMSSLAGLTGRPNQFIEKQITKALINPQYKDDANLLIYEGIKGLSDLKEKEVQYALELEERLSSKGQEVPRNFQKIIQDKLKKDAEKFEKRYENSVRKKLGSVEDVFRMRDPSGKLRNVTKSDYKKALDAGYKLIK